MAIHWAETPALSYSSLPAATAALRGSLPRLGPDLRFVVTATTGLPATGLFVLNPNIVLAPHAPAAFQLLVIAHPNVVERPDYPHLVHFSLARHLEALPLDVSTP